MIEAVVDRLVIRDGVRTRLADSVDTALKWGGSRLHVLRQRRRCEFRSRGHEHRYSTDFSNPETGFTLPQLTPEALLLQQPPRRLPGLPRARHGAGLRSGSDHPRSGKVARRRRDRAVGQGGQADGEILRRHPRLAGQRISTSRWRRRGAICRRSPRRAFPRHRRARDRTQLGRKAKSSSEEAVRGRRRRSSAISTTRRTANSPGSACGST